MRFDCIPPEFSPFRNLKKIIGKLNSLTVRKKKKNKSRPTDPSFKFWSGEGNITIFLFWPKHLPNCLGQVKVRFGQADQEITVGRIGQAKSV